MDRNELGREIARSHQTFIERGYVVKRAGQHGKSLHIRYRGKLVLILSPEETEALEIQTATLWRQFMVGNSPVSGSPMCRHFLLLPMLLLGDNHDRR